MKILQKVTGFIIALVIIILAVFHFGSNNNTPNNSSSPSAANNSLSLITEPQVGVAPELKLIDSAKKSVDLVMYELEDKNIEQALVAAQNRGVSVKVLLNKGYYGQQSRANVAAYNYLHNNYVPVEWTPKYFSLTHEKMLEADGKTASIMTFNFTPEYYATSRDFGVNDNNKQDLAAIIKTFSADWQATKITAPTGNALVWSPGSESAMINLINSSKKSLGIYNEEMADNKIDTALENAAKRGVNVEVTMTNSSEWKTDFESLTKAGVHVRTYAANAKLYIHAKMILVDNQKVFLGSENFSTTSLDRNRELGLILSSPQIIKSLNTTFASDYQAATPFKK
ncbi:MAG: phospholipase D-like domain-containing protein [Candidatus Saccharimonadales bacterium]